MANCGIYRRPQGEGVFSARRRARSGSDPNLPKRTYLPKENRYGPTKKTILLGGGEKWRRPIGIGPAEGRRCEGVGGILDAAKEVDEGLVRRS